MKSVGLKTIAYELNVSVNTVSRALRDCDDISEETKTKVRQKAYELGYMPNNISQFINKDNQYLITIIMNSFHNLYFFIICEKLVAIFKEKKYDFSIIFTNENELTTNVIKQCISQRTDAIITLLEPNDNVVDVAKLNNIPILMIGRTIKNDYVDEIYTDDKLGGKLAANYLANFHKVNKFIYIRIPNIECSDRRENAFVDTIKEIYPNNFDIKIIDIADIRKDLLNLIHQGYLGIFCFNDEIAYDCLSILNNEIPNIRKINPRLHIIGYDCISTRLNGLIDITSIDFDYDQICNQAFSILKEKIVNKKLQKQSIMFSVKLHQRKYF